MDHLEVFNAAYRHDPDALIAPGQVKIINAVGAQDTDLLGLAAIVIELIIVMQAIGSNLALRAQALAYPDPEKKAQQRKSKTTDKNTGKLRRGFLLTHNLFSLTRLRLLPDIINGDTIRHGDYDTQGNRQQRMQGQRGNGADQYIHNGRIFQVIDAELVIINTFFKNAHNDQEEIAERQYLLKTIRNFHKRETMVIIFFESGIREAYLIFFQQAPYPLPHTLLRRSTGYTGNKES